MTAPLRTQASHLGHSGPLYQPGELPVLSTFSTQERLSTGVGIVDIGLNQRTNQEVEPRQYMSRNGTNCADNFSCVHTWSQQNCGELKPRQGCLAVWRTI